MFNISGTEESHLNKMNRAAQDIELGTYLTNVSNALKYYYAGVREAPSIVDNGGGVDLS